MTFSNIYAKYKNKWIVLTNDLKEVIASDSMAKKAYQKAIDKGVKKPILFKVPQKNIPYFGAFF